MTVRRLLLVDANPAGITNATWWFQLGARALAVEALKLFQQHKISDLFATDGRGRPVGYIDVQDLPKLKML